MTGELWGRVDGFAGASHLSRSQVVERALLAYFGEAVAESPSDIPTPPPGKKEPPPGNGPRIGFHAKKGNNGPTASHHRSNQTGGRVTS